MNRKAFIVVLLVLVLFSLNFSVAQEIDNSTSDDSDSLIDSNALTDDDNSIDNNALSASDVNQSVVESSSKVKTQFEVKSNTTFDVVDEYFKVKLSDDKGNVLKNAKVTFTVAGTTYSKTTDKSGIASLQLRLDDGSYKITTKYSGNPNFLSSSLTTTITMNNTRIVDSGLSNSEIQKIIDNAKDKNVILFKGKSYSDINLMITKRLTLISNSNTVLKSSSSSPVITIKGKGASSTIIKGFKIRGAGNGIVISDSDLVRIVNNDISAGGHGIVATGTKYLNITKNNINKNSKSGIVIGNTVSTYIFDNEITNNGLNAIEMAKSDKVYIHGNTITNNKKNGIVSSKSVNDVNYGEGPKNVYINKNTISKNGASGIIINDAGDNINIKSNTIVSNKKDGIALANVGNNAIKSNVITNNEDNGIKFFNNYVKPKNQDISYNAIFGNTGMDVEAKETYYQDTGERLELGDNWYTDRAGICPKIKANKITFSVKQVGPNQFQAAFYDSNGNIASLLPDRTLTYKVANGKSYSVDITGGSVVFTVDANNGDLVKSVVDYSPRENKYNSNTKVTQASTGKSPEYTYPDIPYDQVDGGDANIEGGNGHGNGNGNGDGQGNGSGNGEGKGGETNRGDGNASTQESSDFTGNSTTSRNVDPANNPSSQANDVSQNVETQSTTSQASASDSSTGNTGAPGSQPGSKPQSVAKQIVIEEDEFFRVTGMSFIVLLIILTIGYYYRDDIREMNSKR